MAISVANFWALARSVSTAVSPPGPLQSGEICFHGLLRGRRPERSAGIPGMRAELAGQVRLLIQRANEATVTQMTAA